MGYASELVEALIRHLESPAVLVGHSYGGVVALAIALRGHVPLGALVLFEPVALKMVAMAGESNAYAMAKAVFDDYISSFEGGDAKAVQKMVDFWFGEGTFGRMPESLTAYLVKETASNIRDVRATFREDYSPDGLRKLTMPVVTVVGDQSPELTHRIAHLIAQYVPHGSLRTLARANHALTTTHVDAVAEVISSVEK